MDIQNLLKYSAEKVVALIPDINDVVENQWIQSSYKSTEEPDDEADDRQDHPKIVPANSQKILQTLGTFWIQQDEESQEFICTLLRMRSKVSKIRVNQAVQQDVRHVFSRGETPRLML